jgi:hypothetical protein
MARYHLATGKGEQAAGLLDAAAPSATRPDYAAVKAVLGG